VVHWSAFVARSAPRRCARNLQRYEINLTVAREIGGAGQAGGDAAGLGGLRTAEYYGNPEHHEYELYPAIEDIDHTRTKPYTPKTTDVIDKQFLCSAEASRFSVPAYRA
jgi:hypothetical protein